jgi:sensor histidine kinase YesM
MVQKSASPLKKRLLYFGQNLAVFILIAVLFTFHTSVNFSIEKREFAFWNFLVTQLQIWLPWVFLTPCIWFLGGRFNFNRMKWPFVLVIHAVIGFLFTFLHAVLVFIFARFSFPYIGGTLWPSVMSIPLKFFNFSLMTYWLILSARFILDTYRRYRQQELTSARLESRLNRSKLDVLQSQLHPHFLFNTLHAVTALVRDNPDEAERMISRLSDLLRSNFDIAAKQEIPLKTELEILDNYLKIMEIRFQDRLKVRIDVQNGLGETLVPSFLLQPLVENSIRYGIAPRREGGTLCLNISGQKDRMTIRIADDGPGFDFPAEDLMKKGLGLANTRQRLDLLYGADHVFRLSNPSEGGAAVEMKIPLRSMENQKGP